MRKNDGERPDTDQRGEKESDTAETCLSLALGGILSFQEETQNILNWLVSGNKCGEVNSDI